MSVSISIQLPDNGTPAQLRQLARRLTILPRVGGRAVATHLRKHFSRLDAERPNQLGGPRSHFYGQARNSVQNPEDTGTNEATVSINHVGIAQRYFGGTITAKNAGALTIPIHPAAHGQRARAFGKLDLIPTKNGNALLVTPATGKGKNKTPGTALFLLTKRITQKPDPSVLPEQTELESVAARAVQEYLDTSTSAT